MVKLIVLKRLAAVLGVGVVSSLITWHTARSIFEEEMNENIRAIREHYRKNLDEELEKIRLEERYRQSQTPDTAEPEESEPDRTPEVAMTMPEAVQEKLEAYGSKIVTNYEDPRAFDRIVMPDKAVSPSRKPEIHLISQEEYDEDSDEFPHQEKYSAVYYDGDDVMTDQYEQVMENYPRAMGVEFLTEFEKHGPDHVVHVRNTSLKMDWEVELVKGPYHEIVLGYHPNATKRRPRKFRDDD